MVAIHFLLKFYLNIIQSWSEWKLNDEYVICEINFQKAKKNLILFLSVYGLFNSLTILKKLIEWKELDLQAFVERAAIKFDCKFQSQTLHSLCEWFILGALPVT